LTHTVPKSSFEATSWLRRASAVQTEAASPKGVSLARVSASFSSVKVSTVTTGPKISSREHSAPSGTSTSTVGATK
jgi:hypothetical protein